MLSAQLVCM
jgi:hypothetical protein